MMLRQENPDKVSEIDFTHSYMKLLSSMVLDTFCIEVSLTSCFEDHSGPRKRTSNTFY